MVYQSAVNVYITMETDLVVNNIQKSHDLINYILASALCFTGEATAAADKNTDENIGRICTDEETATFLELVQETKINSFLHSPLVILPFHLLTWTLELCCNVAPSSSAVV